MGSSNIYVEVLRDMADRIESGEYEAITLKEKANTRKIEPTSDGWAQLELTGRRVLSLSYLVKASGQSLQSEPASVDETSH